MNIVFFTGSGISQQSGIPTFRDNIDSFWNNFDAFEIASAEGLKDNPAKVLHFHNEARKMISKCEPNYCHKILADLEKQHNITIITTNIDNLHEKAGNSRVYHVHGNIFEVCDINRNNPYFFEEDIQIGNLHPQTGKQLRHNTVLFNESLNEDVRKLYGTIVKHADLLIVIGSGLSVAPSNNVVYYNDNIVILDPNKPFIWEPKWEWIQKDAVNGIDEVVEMINNLK